MTKIRNWINLVENTNKEREFYINQANEYRAEQNLWWPISSELMASYRDGSHTNKAANGSLIWSKNGYFHRDGDKPAWMWADGSLAWYKNGEWHRDGDKPAEIFADGTLEWWKNGRQHRDGDKPAVIRADGTLEWYKNGLQHRLAGPAIIGANNNFQWWFKGKRIPVTSQEEYLNWLEKNGHVDVYRLRQS
jgi:hypothetical protein